MSEINLLDRLVIKTLQGLEPALAVELEQLGATQINPVKRAVQCRGDKAVMYRICYESRLALRVLKHIHTFKAYNEKNLYEGVRSVDWSAFMNVDDTLAIDAVTAGKTFNHSQYVALLTKDAIVDQFRDNFRRRPSVNTGSPILRIHVRVNENQVDLLLDASGDSLHKRGYRKDTVDAPLNEVLAAGLIAMSGWDAQSPFYDPMCGSGTLVIEAAMMARRQPVQQNRQSPLGFTRWRNFDRQIWNMVKAEADGKMLDRIDFPVAGSDMNPRARNAASINAMAVGLEKMIPFEKIPFEKVVAPAESGTMIVNPPYHERLVLPEVEQFYKSLGDTFKKSWPGWTCWIISANKEAMKNVGLRPSRRIEILNGALECTFQRFDMYEGKKFGHKDTNPPEQEIPASEQE